MNDFNSEKPFGESFESEKIVSDHGENHVENDAEKSDNFGEKERENNPISSNDDLNWDYTNSDDKKDESPQLNFDSSQPMVQVSVDWIELEGALENNSPDLHSFICKETGDVIRVFRGSTDADVRLRSIETDNTFVHVEPISSREQYRWMEDFIEGSEESNLKDKLNIAIDGKGAFRRFKDVLVGYPEDRVRWFVKRSGKLRNHMSQWLTSKRIEPINIPPWDQDSLFDDRNKNLENSEITENEESKSASSGETTTDLRQISHGLVDLIPSRELPTAVAFLEFLRSRRGTRRPRYS